MSNAQLTPTQEAELKLAQLKIQKEAAAAKGVEHEAELKRLEQLEKDEEKRLETIKKRQEHRPLTPEEQAQMDELLSGIKDLQAGINTDLDNIMSKNYKNEETHHPREPIMCQYQG